MRIIFSQAVYIHNSSSGWSIELPAAPASRSAWVFYIRIFETISAWISFINVWYKAWFLLHISFPYVVFRCVKYRYCLGSWIPSGHWRGNSGLQRKVVWDGQKWESSPSPNGQRWSSPSLREKFPRRLPWCWCSPEFRQQGPRSSQEQTQ